MAPCSICFVMRGSSRIDRENRTDQGAVLLREIRLKLGLGGPGLGLGLELELELPGEGRREDERREGWERQGSE